MNRRCRRWIVMLVLLAIVLRAGAVLALRSHLVPRSTYEHGEIAANLLAGRGFSIRLLGAEGPTSQQAPLYPFVVAAAYAIGGVETPRALLLLELAQAVLGGLLVFGVIRLTRRAAPDHPRSWLIAGLLAAVHPTLVYAATHVQVALLGAMLLVWSLEWAYQAGASRRGRDALAAGVLLGLLALTDPILSLASVGILLALRQGSGAPASRRGALRLAAVVLGSAAAVVSPWLVRNLRVHGEFVAIKSTFGYAFWQGNCALSQGTDKVVRESVDRVLEGKASAPGLEGLNRTLWAARHEAGYLDDIALSREDLRELGSLSEPERSRRLFHRALEDLRHEPGRYLRLCLQRLRYFWLFDETNPKTKIAAYRVGHVGLTALAFAGLVCASAEVRRRLAPTLLAAILIAAFHVLTIVSVRFHIPIEPLMATWAGAGLVPWRERLGTTGSAPAGDDVVSVRVVNRFHRQRIRRAGSSV